MAGLELGDQLSTGDLALLAGLSSPITTSTKDDSSESSVISTASIVTAELEQAHGLSDQTDELMEQLLKQANLSHDFDIPETEEEK